MSLLKTMKKEFATETAAEDLRVNSTKPLQEEVINALKAWGKRKGYKYKRSIQSAQFTLSWFDPDKPRLPVLSLDGWHGSGKGNRNYGNSFMIHSLYGDTHKKHFRFSDTLDGLVAAANAREHSFASTDMKNKYTVALNKFLAAIKADKIETMWK